MSVRFRKSEASDGEVSLYTKGFCHVFALALHRRLGGHLLVITDEAEPYWQDPADADNCIATVVHVYAVDPRGNAWDIRGVRPAEKIPSEIARYHPDTQQYSSDENSEEELRRTYVGCDVKDDEVIDRPLCEFEESDVLEADKIATRALAALLKKAAHPFD